MSESSCPAPRRRHRPRLVAAGVAATAVAALSLTGAVAGPSLALSPASPATAVVHPTAAVMEMVTERSAEVASRSAARAATARGKQLAATEKAGQIAAAQQVSRAEARKKAAARAEARKKAAARKAAAAALAKAQADPQAVARTIMGEYGFGADQWGCLQQLWTGESNWSYQATNPSSGAYGIPQALPAAKMASAGADWATNPETQIRWGLQYIRSAYGTPCGALNFWNSNSPHWY